MPRKFFWSILLALLSVSAGAASFSACQNAGQIQIVCPQTITDASTVSWSGGHEFLHPTTAYSLASEFGYTTEGAGANGVVGDARGAGATDLQTFRTTSGQVASGSYAALGGGVDNTASGPNSTISGGAENIASAIYTSVSGGLSNTASGDYSTVGGGGGNSATYLGATVAGGGSVVAGNVFAFAGGGTANTASGPYSVITGGSNNAASGANSSILGGDNDVASGDFSVAIGRRAKALSNGAIIIADSTDADFSSTQADQFGLRAAGGADFEVPYSTFSGVLSVGAGDNIIYYCTGSTAGTFDGNLARGNSNAGACSGGTWIATSLKVD